MINTINEARTPGELAAWLRQWADGADASDHLDDNDARQLAEAVERVCAPGNAAAMREALERIVGWCEGCHSDACEKVCRPELTSESIHAALAALAAPARNCDLLDANGAWKGFLARGNNAEISASYQTGANAAIRWLYAAAEGGAE